MDILSCLDRRRFVKLTGVLAGGAILAACDGDDDTAENGATTDTGEVSEASRLDITVTRTAASLELFVVSVYDTAITNAADLKISEGVVKTATLFKKQHEGHAKTLNGAATELGGEEYPTENPKAAEQFGATLSQLETEQDVLRFAYALEVILAQTYQGVGARRLSTATLRQTAMSVGGVAARHAAVLGMFLQPPVNEPAVAFQPVDKAVDDSYFV